MLYLVTVRYIEQNKLASIKATLVHNYVRPTDQLMGVTCRAKIKRLFADLYFLPLAFHKYDCHKGGGWGWGLYQVPSALTFRSLGDIKDTCNTGQLWETRLLT